MGIYAPQTGKEKVFFKFIKENLILMGDLNSVMEERLDRSGETSAYSRIPQVLRNWLKQRNVMDVWKEYNKTVKDYTFYSGKL